MKRIIPSILLCLCTTQAYAANTYDLTYATKAPVIDGNANDAVWQQADTVSDFSFPWRKDTPPATHFRALWDADALYFLYEVKDKHLAIGKDPSRGALDSDRVEVFLAKDKVASVYYTMEIDPEAQIYSARATYSMDIKKRTSLDDSFKWGNLDYAAKVNKEGYTVEIKLPRSKITELGLWQDQQQTQLLCALMRAEFTPLADGSLDMGWMTWKDPNTKKPNFHNPGTFGECTLKAQNQ